MSLLLVTDQVDPEERAIAYYEMNLQSPAGEQRRYEIIKVVRNDREAEYRRDLGKATKVDQIRIPSYMEHTVNELREMANQIKLATWDKLDLVGVDRIK